MYCYRRWGHNEADEPSFTQPLLYQAIEHKPSVRDGISTICSSWATSRGKRPTASPASGSRSWSGPSKRLHRGGFTPAPQTLTGIWEGYQGGDEPADDDPQTGVPVERLSQLLTQAHAQHRRLPSAQNVAAQHRATAGDGGGKAAARLVGRRSPRLCDAADRRTSGPTHRAGLAAGHVQPASRRLSRRRRRQNVLSAGTPGRGSGAGRDHQQPALAKRACSGSSTATASTVPRA